MLKTLPVTAQTMIMCYRGTIDKAIENLTNEQIEHVLSEMKTIIEALECEDAQ